MTININKLGQNAPITQKANQAQNQQSNIQDNNNNQVKPARQDSVSLTPQAQQLSESQKKGNESGHINQKKVEQLKQAISAGEYKVDPEKLAASMSKFEFDLF